MLKFVCEFVAQILFEIWMFDPIWEVDFLFCWTLKTFIFSNFYVTSFCVPLRFHGYYLTQVLVLDMEIFIGFQSNLDCTLCKLRFMLNPYSR